MLFSFSSDLLVCYFLHMLKLFIKYKKEEALKLIWQKLAPPKPWRKNMGLFCKFVWSKHCQRIHFKNITFSRFHYPQFCYNLLFKFYKFTKCSKIFLPNCWESIKKCTLLLLMNLFEIYFSERSSYFMCQQIGINLTNKYIKRPPCCTACIHILLILFMTASIVAGIKQRFR